MVSGYTHKARITPNTCILDKDNIWRLACARHETANRPLKNVTSNRYVFRHGFILQLYVIQEVIQLLALLLQKSDPLFTL